MRRTQSGQVAVLFAFGSMALIAMVGLVFMVGLLYWDQRELQTVADGAALVGAQNITKSCAGTTVTSSQGPLYLADQFAAQQLGQTSALSISGGCTSPSASCGTSSESCYVGTDTFGGGSYSATYAYPWNNHAFEVAVFIRRSGIGLQFSSFIGASQASIAARAVAQQSFATLPQGFAMFAQNGVQCQGSGGTKIIVDGSLYAGQSTTAPASPPGAAPQSLLWNGNCAIVAHATTAFDGTTDPGDILGYDDNQSWAASGGTACSASSPAQAICADGLELAGHLTPGCGINAGGTPFQTEYLGVSTTTYPDPCQGEPPPVPLLSESSYQTQSAITSSWPSGVTDPNSDPAVDASIGGACTGTTSSQTAPSSTGSDLTNANNKKYGWGPAPVTVGSVLHFQKGCYGYLDLGTLQSKLPAGVSSFTLDPGFYFFNGYHCGLDSSSGCSATTGGGLCLNGSGSQSMILTANDVSFEFVNSSSFSSASCAAGPTSACGGSACDFGTSILAPGNYSEHTSVTPSTSVGTLPAGVYYFETTYIDSRGETTASAQSSMPLSATLSATGSMTVAITSNLPPEATGVGFYLVQCTGGSGGLFNNDCGAGGVKPGYIGCAGTPPPGEASCTGSFTASTSGSLTFSSPGQGNYVGVPPTNTASIWFAAPPSSPESSPSAATFTPLSCSGSTKCSDLPAGTYTIEATYRTASCASSTGTVCSNYGETPPCDAAGASPTCTTSQEQVTISAGQEIQITVGSAPQGVTKVAFYLLNTTGTGVNTGYIGQVAAPVGSPTTFTLSGSGQGVPSASAPTANTTYSSWCSTTDTAAGFSSGDTAVCADRLIWAPPASCTCTESQIAGTFYVKGSNENSAMEGNIYWPGAPTVPSAPASNQSGCQYSANGVGGLLGEVVCDSIFIQGGSSAGEATIGYSSGANLGVPPEVQLIE